MVVSTIVPRIFSGSIIFWTFAACDIFLGQWKIKRVHGVGHLQLPSKGSIPSLLCYCHSTSYTNNYIQPTKTPMNLGHFVFVVDLCGIFKARIKVLMEILWTPRDIIISIDNHISIALQSAIVILNLF